MNQFDVIVVGAGIGGLVSAALLADGGASVLLLEQHAMVGGCCASFTKNGYLFEAGATVGCGFHPGGPLDWLGNKLQLKWPIAQLPVAWDYRDGDLHLEVTHDRDQLISTFPRSRRFWSEQQELAATLWEFTTTLLNQYGRPRTAQLTTIARQLLQRLLSPRLLRLAAGTGSSWLHKHRLESDLRFKRFIDAQLLISAQASSERTNGLFSALALDLPRRNPCQIEGGVGTIADLLSKRIQQAGGTVRLGERVTQLSGSREALREVVTSRGSYRCRQLVINGSSCGAAKLLGVTPPARWSERNRAYWGAFVLHLGLIRDIGSELRSPYLQLLAPQGRKLGECGSLFLSIPKTTAVQPRSGCKTGITVSTHTEVAPWWEAQALGKDHYLARKKQYETTILELIDHYFEGLRNDIDCCFSGSPITYHRYTGRHQGLVGGYAQTSLFPPRQETFGRNNLWYTGDHCFPGQSMAGVTVGAALIADTLLRRL